jgi:DNA polymerase-3 subunit beta
MNVPGRGHVLTLSSGEQIYRSELRSPILVQNAGLKIILTESCAKVMIRRPYQVYKPTVALWDTFEMLFFRTKDNTEIFSFPLSTYNFPNYHELLNKYEDQFNSVLEINKNDLIESLDRLRIFNSETSSTYFKLNENELLLYVEGNEIGEAYESLPCNYKGSIKVIVLLTKDLIDILSHFDSEVVKFYFSGQTDPCKITGEEDYNYFVITMPVEIEEEIYYTEEEV